MDHRLAADHQKLPAAPRGQAGGTPLCAAASRSSIDLLQLLLLAGANPSAGFPSPLHAAVRSGCPAHVAALLAAGASVDAIDDDLKTPLLTVAGLSLRSRDGRDMLRLLLDAGADVHARDAVRWRSIIVAAISQDLSALRLSTNLSASASLAVIPEWLVGAAPGCCRLRGVTE